jgi:hypothetical protein
LAFPELNQSPIAEPVSKMKWSPAFHFLPAIVPIALGSVLPVTGRDAIEKRNEVTANWCGAVSVAPSGTTFKTVVGTWTIPELSLRSGQTVGEGPSIGQWVGISDDNGGLIQGGTYSVVRHPH